MTHIICSSNPIRVYKNILSNTYKNRKIHYKDLKSCIHTVWNNVEFVDIVIQNNEFNLQICCEHDNSYNTNCNTRRFFEVIEKHRRLNNNQESLESYTKCDQSFVRVARELNDWHIGNFVIEKINVISQDYDSDTKTDKSVIIPLGVPISRITEFYGVRGL